MIARWVAVAGLIAAVGLGGCTGADGDPATGGDADELPPSASPTAGTGATGASRETSAGATSAPPSAEAPLAATDEPATDEPGTDEPGTDEPGTDEPGTDEVEGAAPEPSSQEVVLGSLPGDTVGACVDADGQRDVRSGGIAAGPFDEASESYTAPGGDSTVSMYWIPAHTDDLSGLTVRGTQVSGGAGTFVHDETKVSELIGDTGTWRYYLTEITIPAPGTWRLEATSGQDTGCFTVTFGG